MESRQKILTKPIVVCAIALLCTLLWGSAFPSIKVGYQMFEIASDDTASQILFAGYRFTIAGMIAWIISTIICKEARLPKRGVWGHVVALGLLQTTLQYIFFYIGMANITGVKSAIISASSSFFSILMAHFLIKGEGLTVKKIIGCVLGFAGIVVINFTSQGFGGGFKLIGEGFAIISCFISGLSSVYVKVLVKRDNAFTITAYQLLLGGIALSIIGLMMGGEIHNFTIKSISLLIYLAMISGVAFSLWALLLQYNSVGKVAIYGFTSPIFGALLSAIVLGERVFAWRNLVALLLVSLGIVIVNIQWTARKTESKYDEAMSER